MDASIRVEAMNGVGGQALKEARIGRAGRDWDQVDGGNFFGGGGGGREGVTEGV